MNRHASDSESWLFHEHLHRVFMEFTERNGPVVDNAVAILEKILKRDTLIAARSELKTPLDDEFSQAVNGLPSKRRETPVARCLVS